jgi:hypothetical protein
MGRGPKGIFQRRARGKAIAGAKSPAKPVL